MTTLLYFIIFSAVILPEFGIVNHFLSLPLIFSALLIFQFNFLGKISLINQSNPLASRLHVIFTSWLITISYVFVIDLIRNEVAKGCGDYIRSIIFMSLFFVIIRLNLVTKVKYIYFLYFILLSSLMAAFQLYKPDFKWENIIPSNSLILSSYPIEDAGDINITNRITGPFSIAVGLPLLLGYGIIISFHKRLAINKLKSFGFSILFFVIGMFTYTRSLTFGILPSILCGAFFYKNLLNIRYIVNIMVISILLFFCFYKIYLPYTMQLDERSAKVLEANTGAKAFSNFYASVGVFHVNPIFGVPREDNLRMVKHGYSIISNNIGGEFELQNTDHNLIAYYFKYYGLLGLGLFLFFVLNLLKCILKLKPQDRFAAISLFIFFFQYSLLHNNKFFDDVFLIVMLALLINLTVIESGKYYEKGNSRR